MKKMKLPIRCLKPAAVLAVLALSAHAENNPNLKQAAAAYERGDYAETKRLLEIEALKNCNIARILSSFCETFVMCAA